MYFIIGGVVYSVIGAIVAQVVEDNQPTPLCRNEWVRIGLAWPLFICFYLLGRYLDRKMRLRDELAARRIDTEYRMAVAIQP